MVIDESMEELYASKGGINVNGTTIPALAYADDLILMSHGANDQQLLANRCVKFFKRRGLSVNPAKCHNFCPPPDNEFKELSGRSNRIGT